MVRLFRVAATQNWCVRGEYASLVSLQVLEHDKRSSSLSQSVSATNASFRESNDRNQQVVKSITTREQEPSDQKLSKRSSSPSSSIWELVKLNAQEWPYAILGSVGAIPAGMEAPLFALGITHILAAFYAPTSSQIKHEVNKVILMFVVLAGITVPMYLLQHYFYTLMGERLTSRVRLLMFSGSFLLAISLLNSLIPHSRANLRDLSHFNCSYPFKRCWVV
ncbi:putative xenobiotic-transporting ATPase [Rosa chinensis]|uniref:Putative xenobiotic-transporting ATPase n=1 Tax=Rosa chinensis TaxID=74649 RepID=A0A2P6PZ99_ROSCH|nr:putative xenobiotic-transporting ATPase [Rosa chinensis]